MKSSFSPEGLKVVVFDVDGTLYRQGPVRRAMLLRLLKSHLFRPVTGWRTLRTLSAYRRAQESLRASGARNVATAQILHACERTGIEYASVSECVERWMEREPLQVLPKCIQPGLREFLETCKARGLRLAALSDYPANSKLQALGIANLFDLVLCAQSPEIGVFKPNPRGLQVVLKRLAVRNHECLYVGDRADVDARAASAAGVPCVIVNSTADDATSHRGVTGYSQLQGLLFSRENTAVSA